MCKIFFSIVTRLTKVNFDELVYEDYYLQSTLERITKNLIYFLITHNFIRIFDFFIKHIHYLINQMKTDKPILISLNWLLNFLIT
jgi:hypothetical protein